MKKINFRVLLLPLIIFCPLFLYGQDKCTGSFTEYFLNSNNIRASFFPRGNKFTTGNSPGFLVPYPSQQKVSTIFASSPWIGGYDDAGNLKLAVETYPGTGSDFSVGPLSFSGTTLDSICGNFDRAWNILGLTFEVEFDTSKFLVQNLITFWPGGTARLIYTSGFDPYNYFKTSFVQTNNAGITIDSNFLLVRSLSTVLTLKPGLPIPDSTIIRLRNLRAVSPDGTDLLLGSVPLVVYKESISSLGEVSKKQITVYPNPCNDFIYVDIDGSDAGQLYDSQGRLITTLMIKADDAIDVSKLEPGIYFLKLLSKSCIVRIVVY